MLIRKIFKNGKRLASRRLNISGAVECPRPSAVLVVDAGTDVIVDVCSAEAYQGSHIAGEGEYLICKLVRLIQQEGLFL
jgi:hypothetical protein